jgi:hypothetical protein
LLLGASSAEAAPRRYSLFYIERSTNKNVVLYDALVERAHGAVSSVKLDVYWRMHERGGEREELTFLERKLAYGYEASLLRPDASFVVVLSACPERKLHVELGQGAPRATVELYGRPARLRRIYVQSQERALLPRVAFVDLFGEALDGGKRLRERLVPS